MAEGCVARGVTWIVMNGNRGRPCSIWRVVGEYANYSIFDVASNDELHQLLQGLPLFPFMKISVTPLAQHPSAI